MARAGERSRSGVSGQNNNNLNANITPPQLPLESFADVVQLLKFTETTNSYVSPSSNYNDYSSEYSKNECRTSPRTCVRVMGEDTF